MYDLIIGTIEDSPLNSAVTYVTVILFAVILLEMLAVIIDQIRAIFSRKGNFEKSNSLRVNGSMGLAMLGALLTLGTKIRMGFSLTLTTTDDVILAVSAGLMLLGYTLFMKQRSNALLDQPRIQILIRIIICVVLLSTIGTALCKYYNLKIGKFSVMNIFYGLMGSSALGFDILFSIIFIKQIRQFNVLFNVEDEELMYVAKVGLAIVAASVSVLFFFCCSIPFSTTSSLNLVFSHLCYQSQGMIVHIYIYTKFLRPFKHRLNSKSSRNSSGKNVNKSTARLDSVTSKSSTVRTEKSMI